MTSKRARLDSKGTAKPKTRLVGHARAGDVAGPGITRPDALEDVETGERTELNAGDVIEGPAMPLKALVPALPCAAAAAFADTSENRKLAELGLIVPPWDGTSAGWRRRLEALEQWPSLAGRSVKPLNDVLAPGFYVSAINDLGQKALVEGPWMHHVEALVRVEPVRRAWVEADHRAHWYAWGTAGVRP